ncbi:CubicO group peptidase (beta-lactamase class C family) [Tenacibaculum adriaticum]|uniref:CubicO group peptidase (Beta-lactamase class C family) n=1 Tax=Tenacibaculum adriaticum TaxID=413713 RepID=A0A5S5DUP1_9FLAO|nr:serine hydrolase domain-containing protein [Tenacibaculum adriaticum]TYP99535.1 CubicO group peptidase (beta-lactamase class C family) [Tenacibaculum adriaticum]
MKKLLYLLIMVNSLTISCQHSTIDEYVQQEYNKGQLNGNVLVVKSDTIIYEKSFGIAHPETKEHLTAAHRFNIGSIYKEFPAVAVMQLFEKGSLKTDDEISNYLDNLPTWASLITIQQLFKYTSGLPKVSWEHYVDNQIPITEELLLKDLKKVEELTFKPGTDYLYSNYNPLLLTLIVEKVTGQSFEDYVQQHIFKPAKMTDSYFGKAMPYKNEVLPAIAFDKDYNFDPFTNKEAKFLMLFTAKDLYQWLYHLHSYQLLSKASIKFLSEREGSQSPLGILEWKDDVLEVHHHHGEQGNYESVIRYYPKDDLYIVILKNQKYFNVMDMADEIHDIVTNTKN